MTVRMVIAGEQVFEVTGEGYDPKCAYQVPGSVQGPAFNLLMKAAALCNNAVLERGGISVGGLFRGLVKGRPAPGWSILGDPTEGALLVAPPRQDTGGSGLRPGSPGLPNCPLILTASACPLSAGRPAGP